MKGKFVQIVLDNQGVVGGCEGGKIEFVTKGDLISGRSFTDLSLGLLVVGLTLLSFDPSWLVQPLRLSSPAGLL